MATMIHNLESNYPKGQVFNFITGTDYDTDALRQITLGRAVTPSGTEGLVAVGGSGNDSDVIGTVLEVISSTELKVLLISPAVKLRVGVNVDEWDLLALASDGDWIVATTGQDAKYMTIFAGAADTNSVWAIPYTTAVTVP